MSNLIKKALKLAHEVDYHREQQELARLELARIEPTLEQIIESAAARHLVDEQGNPADGGIYWYEHQAIVRVDGQVVLIRMETMSATTVFAGIESEAEPKDIAPELPVNGKVHDQEVEL
jgi:hypothetical protein